MAKTLDFSPLQRSNEILQSQAMRSQNTSKAISSIVGVGKQYLDVNNKRREEILKNTSFDNDLTVNAVVNDYYQQMFNDMVRQPMVNKLSEKGKIGYISPQDVNESQLLNKQFERELGLAKNVVNSWNKAKSLSEDPKNFGIYELDEEKWNGFMDIITGKYEENPSEYMRSIYKTGEVNESPFLKIKAADINSTTNVLLNDALKQMPTDEEILKKEYDSKGKTITETNRQQVLGQAKKEMLGDVMFNLLKTGKYGDLRNIAKGAQVSIKQNMPQAVDPISAISFFIDKKVEDYFGGMEKAIVQEKKSKEVEPSTKTGGAGGGTYTTVDKTNVGWEFGSTPISLSKKITYTDEKGNTKSETFKNASVVAVNDQNKTATIVVPKSKDEDLNEILKEARENEGLNPTDTSMDAKLMDALLSTEKFKSVTIPLKDVYNELKSGFDKKKLYLKGFENIKLEEGKEKISW